MHFYYFYQINDADINYEWSQIKLPYRLAHSMKISQFNIDEREKEQKVFNNIYSQTDVSYIQLQLHI